jgi:hypothetical protein
VGVPATWQKMICHLLVIKHDNGKRWKNFKDEDLGIPSVISDCERYVAHGTHGYGFSSKRTSKQYPSVRINS